jgi:hypothetical protein
MRASAVLKQRTQEIVENLKPKLDAIRVITDRMLNEGARLSDLEYITYWTQLSAALRKNAEEVDRDLNRIQDIKHILPKVTE